MEIDHQEVCRQLEQLALELGLKDDQSLPVPLLVEIHGFQDYALAYFCNLINTPVSWDIQVCTYFVDSINSEIYQHEYSHVLPGMRNSEMMLGTKKYMVKRNGGMKSQWKGILKEIEDAYSDDKKIKKSHEAIKTIFYFRTEASFISESAYDHFYDLLRCRDNATLINELEKIELTINRQKLAQLA